MILFLSTVTENLYFHICVESSQIILQWINATEGCLLSEEVKLTNLSVMKEQQQRLQEFVDAAVSHERNLERVGKSEEAVCSEAGSVEELKSRYAEVKVLLDERMNHLG